MNSASIVSKVWSFCATLKGLVKRVLRETARNVDD